MESATVKEQDLEVKGMQDWLSVKSYPAMSMCDSHDSHGDSHGSHGDSHGSHGDSHGEMSMGCGNMNGAGAQALVKANQQILRSLFGVSCLCFFLSCQFCFSWVSFCGSLSKGAVKT